MLSGEMGIKADKQDDLLLSEFPSLRPVDNKHIIPIPIEVLQIKFNYLNRWIEEVLDMVEQLNNNRTDGGRKLDGNSQSKAIIYAILDLAYKIDYLITPHGKVMDHIEKVHTIYFAQNEANPLERIERMLKEFEKILSVEDKKVFSELYDVKATFAVAGRTNPAQILSIIANVTNDAIYYTEQKHPKIALVILSYIASYCLFDFALPKFFNDFFHLIISTLNGDLMKELGFQQLVYNEDTKRFNKNFIRQQLHEIQAEARKKYPYFTININHINYTELTDFIVSLYKIMLENNYEEGKAGA